MFLTPHHFQQADRYYEHLISRRLRAVRALGLGVCRLALNTDALANGELVLSKCAAILPDGLAVDTPDLDPLPPARPIEGFFDAKRNSLRVLFEGEPLDDYTTLKIAELTRTAAGKFVASDTYVPPCLFLSASPQLVAYLRRILEMISAKSSDLASQRR